MQTFFGMLMGIVYMPRRSMCWANDELYQTAIFGHEVRQVSFAIEIPAFH